MKTWMLLSSGETPPGWEPVRHPAKYTDSLLPVFARLIDEYLPRSPLQPISVLDPMAGTGKVALLVEHGIAGRVVANEIEIPWAFTAQRSYPWLEVHVGDARHMAWAREGEFDVVCTSPTYGNRMADHHEARDASTRYTYRHALGRNLSEGNTGSLQWGEAYREAHRAIWAECIRVLRPGGLMIVNVKDHVRGGEVQPVSAWHAQELEQQGLSYVHREAVETPSMRNGANADKRIGHEDVWVFRKPWR